MNVELKYRKRLVLDLTTEGGSRGNSAANQGVSDPDTEVYYGGLHASVLMRDVNVEIVMDPESGNWKDADWARRRAWEAACHELTAGDLFKICTLLYESGKGQGKQDAKREIRSVLGIKE